jgi:aspartyl-tRNA(Asn)/glutamyl-tRNA(Gln) amidotransferase subunit A
MDEALRYATAAELRAWYAGREVSPTEFTRATLDLLDACEPALHAFLTVTADLALAQAATAERLIHSLGDAAWEDRPLLGVPVSVKDLTPTEGVRTTRGSLRHAGWIPDRDAPAVARLRRAGAVLIGKTTTSEFGWSAGTVNLLAPPAANPWDSTRSAGGSSGGAAAATAAGMGIAALGTDGAGSIRVPAAFCGVVGFKPTFGRIPYAPLSPEGLSHLGPLARDVATAALVTEALAGADPDDPFSTSLPPQRPVPARTPRIGWLRWGGPVSEVSEVAAVARSAAQALGGDVEELEVPFADPYPHLVTILAASEAAGEQAAGEQAAEPADAELSDPARLRVVEHGRGLRAVDLARAQAERLLLTRCLDRVMERFDVLAMPTVWVEPFAVDAWRPDPPSTADGLDWLAWCRAAYPFNLTGQPAISVPAGWTAAGYPVGLQLVGRRHEDRLLFRVAGQFEHARPWRHGYPRKDRQQR